MTTTYAATSAIRGKSALKSPIGHHSVLVTAILECDMAKEDWGTGKHKNNPCPNPVIRSEQIEFVWRHSRLGYTQAWIGENMPTDLGGRCTQSTVSKLMKEGRQLHAPPAAEDERILALQRNQEQYQALALVLEGGLEPDVLVKVISAMDRIERTRHDLLGIKAPKRIDLTTHEVDNTDIELNEIINEAKTKRAKREAEIHGDGPMDPR